jgi:hypothetical protein
VLAKAVERADEILTKAGLSALPEGLTLHALRRTFCSVLLALNKPAPDVMAAMGHDDPKVTLGIYAKVMRASEEDGYSGRLANPRLRRRRRDIATINAADDRALRNSLTRKRSRRGRGWLEARQRVSGAINGLPRTWVPAMSAGSD